MACLKAGGVEWATASTANTARGAATDARNVNGRKMRQTVEAATSVACTPPLKVWRTHELTSVYVKSGTVAGSYHVRTSTNTR